MGKGRVSKSHPLKDQQCILPPSFVSWPPALCLTLCWAAGVAEGAGRDVSPLARAHSLVKQSIRKLDNDKARQNETVVVHYFIGQTVIPTLNPVPSSPVLPSAPAWTGSTASSHAYSKLMCPFIHLKNICVYYLPLKRQGPCSHGS